jgi:hypothetical protein
MKILCRETAANVWKHVQKYGRCKSGDAAAACLITPRMARTHMERLTEQGCLRRVGELYEIGEHEVMTFGERPAEVTRECTRCGKKLFLHFFATHKGRPVSRQCRSCVSKMQREYREQRMTEEPDPPEKAASDLLDGLTRCWGVKREELQEAA